MSEIYCLSRHRMHTDGPGITTLIGMHGCPLHCADCINPQCHDHAINIADFSAEELIEVLKIDDIYFRMSGGGIVFGGGEPLLQSEFILDVCEKMPESWNCTIETSLNIEWRQIQLLLPHIDLWIIDIKDLNPDIYQAYTGSSNQLLYENLDKLIPLVDTNQIKIRIPLIPGYNTEEDMLISSTYLTNTYGEALNIEYCEYITQWVS